MKRWKGGDEMDRLDVKVGDTILVCGMWYKRRISTVQKVTPTGKIRVDGNLYDANGFRRINKWESEYIQKPTSEQLKQVRDEYKINKALKMCHEVKVLTIEQAEKIVDILLNDKTKTE